MSSTVRFDSDQESDDELDSFGEENIEEPLYLILSEFLVNDKGENIVTVLTRMTEEIKLLRETLEKKGIKQDQSTEATQ